MNIEVSHKLILQKEVKDEADFLHENKHQSCLQTDTSFLLFVTRHVQSTLNKMFVVFFEYLKKEVTSKVDC